MIELDNKNVNGFEAAIRGMRNPLESWGQSDSRFGIQHDEDWSVDRLDYVRNKWMIHNGYGEIFDCETETDKIKWLEKADEVTNWLWDNSLLDMDGNYTIRYFMGPKDLKVAQNLVRAGADEGKFMRQITVSVDITAPLYWWKEMDTYKIGTTADSTSTMHKIAARPITLQDFSFDEELDSLSVSYEDSDFCMCDAIESVITTCETLRQEYLRTKDKSYWRALIQLLPESYNQTRTWTANYAVLRNIYFARRNHKLTEWHDFCSWIEGLPYAKELICVEEKKEK